MAENQQNQQQFARETDSRILIDRQLREAGWDIEDKNQVSTEESTKDGRIDYLLRDNRGRGLAVIEAKKFSIDPVLAKNQALNYAKEIGADFIFLANGEDIYFWDHRYRPETKVSTFFSQKDLEKIMALRKMRKPLSDMEIPDKIFFKGNNISVRPYQKEALKAIDKSIEQGKRGALLVMATGTGKTLTVAMQIKRMFQAGLVSRVLFLVDRIELGKQAQETFDDYLKEYPSELLYGGKRKKESSIVIGTLPTIYSQLGNFTSGYFDLVISDESHRGIYHLYKKVFSYFDALKIGVTATPSLYVDRNTYKMFGCWNDAEEKGEPTFAYGIRRGIDEGYLAGYDIVRIDTEVSTKGIKYEGEDYNPEDLERVINVPARNEQIVKAYRQEEEKREPKKHRKAIVFAVTQNHAAQLAYYFNQEYPEFKGRFAEIITSNIADVDQAIKRFKREELPCVAVSVGMLDAGFDAPKVENIIMARPTKSPMLYQQMRGRGSRLAVEIKKIMFRIYDFVGVTRDFKDVDYNPYLKEIEKRNAIPWGTEESDLSVEEKIPENLEKLFVQVAETDKENVDVVLQREYVEIGLEGKKVDVDDYQNEWEKEIRNLSESDAVVQKIKDGQELTNEEIRKLGEKLNNPEFYFNESNLRTAFRYPEGTMPEFVKEALGVYELPTPEKLRENKINDLFEAWLVEKNFDSEKAKILRMIKAQFLANNQKPDVSIFNSPLFSQFGGIVRISRIFGESELSSVIAELNNKVFVA